MEKKSEQELQAGTDAPSSVSTTKPKTSELTSQVLRTENPFDILTTYNPANQTTKILLEVNEMIGTSFKDWFRQAAPWILELKNKRFEVRPGSKGKQIDVGGEKLYWHEFYEHTFHITKRHFQQLEKQIAEGTWEQPKLTAGDHVYYDKEGHTFEGEIVKIHESADKIDVQRVSAESPDAAAPQVLTVKIDDVRKVSEPKRLKITSVGQVVLCSDVDGGSEFEYLGGGKLKRTKTPSANLQRKAQEEARAKAQAESARLKKQTQEEAERQKQAELTKKALDALKDEEQMLEEKKRMVKQGKIPAGLVAKRVGKRKAPSSDLALVKVAKLEGEDGWALFEKAESAPFTLNKASSGRFDKLAECEAARDRVNERRAKKADGGVGEKVA
jgi:hypothetical protein